MEAPAISVERAIEWKDEICSLVAGRNGYGVGDAAGGFSLVCRDGVVAWRTESQGAAVAVCPVSDLKGNEFWVVGYDLKDVPKPESHWRIYDGEGKELCGETSNFGRITTIFPFRCNESGEKGFIIGTTGWMALAYDLTGKRLWTFKCYHNMICGAAADCNQDGADEILLGAGYYYHQMLNAKGKMLFQRNCDAWNYDVAVTDINGDGIPEFICGREDDAVHVMTPLDTKPEPDIKPLKLGGVPIKLASCANGFAVAVENGAVVRVGTGMSLLWSTELPSGLAGLAEADDHFYTVCRDGYLYRLDGTGKVTGKLPFATNSASYYRPIVVAGSLGLAASSGHRLIMLK